MPLRFLMYSGPVNWHEQGMRFAWKVLVRKKSGTVTYRVLHEGRSRERLVYPSSYLTGPQEREMAGQPDQVLQLAHHIADDFRARGYRDVEVRADAFVSWNGRAPAPLIDASVDLAEVSDSLAPAAWIAPAPNEDPPHLGKRLGKIWR
jgi:hypothetical protein